MSRSLRVIDPIYEGITESKDLSLDKNTIKRHLKSLPYAINALADPAILRESTASKLNTLAKEGHSGPVALITKGDLSTKWWRDKLTEWSRSLDLHIFCSVSGLPKSYEPVSLDGRFRTMSAAREAGAKVLCYLRPIVPGVNDSFQLLGSLVSRAADCGAQAVISSGFRGEDTIVKDSGFSSNFEGQAWLPSVKLHKVTSEEHVRKLCEKLGMIYTTGTSCAVAVLGKKARSLSPYSIAPQFARCSRCSLRESCFEKRDQFVVSYETISLLKLFGYQLQLNLAPTQVKSCDVSNRSNCNLHCTNCKRAAREFNVPHIELSLSDGSIPSWGDLCFARFLSGGILVTNRDLSDKEESNITLDPRFGIPSSGAGSLYATTSWMMWSEYLPKERCFKCSYCFVGMYKDKLPSPMQGTVGYSPESIADLLFR